MIKLVTFDFDDTLVTLGKRFYENTIERCKILGIDMPSKKDFKKASSLPWNEFYNTFFNDLDENYFWSVLEFDKYKNSELVSDYPLVRDFLKEQNILMGVLTSSTRKRMDGILENINGINYNDFDFFFTLDDCEKRKPHKEAFYPVLDFAYSHNIEERQILYIDDNPNGLETAIEAEIDFVGVTTGLNEKEDFIKANLSEHRIYDCIGYAMYHLKIVERIENIKKGIYKN